jgi:hypothetical protein
VNNIEIKIVKIVLETKHGGKFSKKVAKELQKS